MTLYEVRIFNSAKHHPDFTRFFTSKAEATRFRNQHRRTKGNTFSLRKCSVPSALSIHQWIELLETDAPGNQNFLLTPVDLITYD